MLLSIFLLAASFFIEFAPSEISKANRRIQGTIIVNFDSEVNSKGELEGNVIAGEEVGRNVKYQIVNADGYNYKIVTPLYDVRLRLARDGNEIFDINEIGVEKEVDFDGSSLSYSKATVYRQFSDWIYNGNSGKAHAFYSIDHVFQGEYPGIVIKREQKYPEDGYTLTGDMRDDWKFTYTLNISPVKVVARSFVEFRNENGEYQQIGTLGDVELNYGQRFSSDVSSYSFTDRVFDGWFHNGEKVSDNLNATLIADMGTITQNDVENKYTNDFYARFSEKKFSVRFHSNDDRNLEKVQQFRYGQSQSLASFTFAKRGYEFAGWATTPNGEVAYSDGQEVSNLTNVHMGTFDLYAVYKPLSFKITLSQEGATTSGTEEVTAVFDQLLPEIEVPAMEGHLFGGYYDQPHGNGKRFYDHQGKPLTKCDFDENIVLYAEFIETWDSVASSKNFELDVDGFYKIEDEIDLASLAYMVNNQGYDTTGLKFKLTKSLDLSGKRWIAMGNVNNPFRGKLDGRNFAISNVRSLYYYDRNQEMTGVGLIGYGENAEIANLKLKEVKLQGSSAVGTVAGILNGGKIENCVVLSGELSGGENVGGLVGKAQNISIEKSISKANVYAGISYAGGLVGQGENLSMTYSYNHGNISSEQVAGGFVGKAFGTVIISKAANFSSLKGSTVGGAIGEAGENERESQITVRSFANYASMTSENKIGLVIGQSLQAGKNCLIEYCSFIGEVSHSNLDLTSSAFGGLISASYFRAEHNGEQTRVAYGNESEFSQGFACVQSVNHSLPIQIELFAIAAEAEKQNNVLSVGLVGFEVRS